MPILREGELDIISYSTEQTQRLGARLGTLLQAGDLVCLSGDMGAGKTVFSSGIGKGWGSLTSLNSPTFNLVHQHHREKDDQILYHIDCYRLKTADDIESIGLDDILSSPGVFIMEWPEYIQPVLPEERLWIELKVMELTRRNLIFEAVGSRYQTLIEQFRSQ